MRKALETRPLLSRRRRLPPAQRHRGKIRPRPRKRRARQRLERDHRAPFPHLHPARHPRDRHRAPRLRRLHAHGAAFRRARASWSTTSISRPTCPRCCRAITPQTRLIFLASPEQPDRHARDQRGARRLPARPAAARHRRARRGLLRIPRRPARHASARCAAARASCSCAPSRKSRAWPACASATASPRRKSPTCSSARASRSTPTPSPRPARSRASADIEHQQQDQGDHRRGPRA